MNVRDADSGSWSKLKTACWAAANALVVFMFVSWMKSASESERGSIALLGVRAAARNCYFVYVCFMRFGLSTIVDDNTWMTKSCPDFRKDFGHGSWI